jgi:hypothetical protein
VFSRSPQGTRFSNTSCLVALIATLKSESTKLASEAFVDPATEASPRIRIGQVALCSPLNPTAFPQVHPGIESRLGGVRLGTAGKMGRVHPGIGARVEMTRLGGLLLQVLAA